MRTTGGDMKPAAIDLFCGAGGLSLGLERAGFRVAAAADFWDAAARTYRANFDHPFLHEDIRTITPERLLAVAGIGRGEAALVAGGPPCQGFSIQRIGEDADLRNDLILEFARLVIGVRPKMFLMENVPGLLGTRGRLLARRFADAMRDAGYGHVHQIVNAAEFGVPQTRRRVFFVGWLRGEAPPFSFPDPGFAEGGFRTVWDAIADLPPPPEDCSPAPEDPLHRRMRLSPRNLERLRLIPPGGGFESLPVEMRVDCHKGGAARIGHRNVYGRLDFDAPAGTITARFDSFTRGKFAHPVEHRNITLREGARLQTFPDEFAFCGSQEEVAALIGNAIPPLLAETLARAILTNLGGDRRPDARSSFTEQMSLFEVWETDVCLTAN